jgi:hypothetical protein
MAILPIELEIRGEEKLAEVQRTLDSMQGGSSSGGGGAPFSPAATDGANQYAAAMNLAGREMVTAGSAYKALESSLRTSYFDNLKTAAMGFATATADVARAVGGALTGAFSALQGMLSTTSGLLGGMAIGKLAMDFINFAGTIDDLSLKTGMSYRELQRFSYAGSLVGVSLEQIANGAIKMQERVASGDKSAVGALNQLGISAEEFKDLEPDAMMEIVATKMGDIANQGEFAAVSMDLMGKSGIALIPFMKTFKEAGDEADRFGFILNDRVIAAGDKAGDAFTKLYTIGKLLIGLPLAEAFDAIAKAANLIRLPQGLQWLVEQAQILGGAFDEDAKGPMRKNPKTGELEQIIPKSPFMRGPAAKNDLLNEDHEKFVKGQIDDELRATQKKQDEARRQAEAWQKELDALSGRGDIKDADKLLKQVNQLGGVGELSAKGVKKFADAMWDAVLAMDAGSKVGDGSKYLQAWAQAGGGMRGLPLTELQNKFFDTGLRQLPVAGVPGLTEMRAPTSLTTSLSQETLDNFALMDQMRSLVRGTIGTGAGPQLMLPGAPGVTQELSQATIDANIKSILRMQLLPEKILRGFTQALSEGMSSAMRGGGFGGFAEGVAGTISSQLTDAFQKRLQAVGGDLSKMSTSSKMLGVAGAGIGVGIDSFFAGKQMGSGKGALMGAGQGALAGTMILPGIGTVIGAGIGALGGAIGGLFKPTQWELQDRQNTQDLAQIRGGVNQTQLSYQLATVGSSWSASQMMGVKDAGALKQMLDDLQGRTDRLKNAMDKYGISWDELGSKAKQAKMDMDAGELIQDFEVLTRAGMGAETVIQKMGGSINTFVQDAIRTGTEVPKAMKPMLDKMISMGLLTDAAGNEMKDLSSITFSNALPDALSKIGDAINNLARALGVAVDTAGNAPGGGGGGGGGGGASAGGGNTGGEPTVDGGPGNPNGWDGYDGGDGWKGGGRYPEENHRGGWAGWSTMHRGGLMDDEIPAILQRGEFVMSRRDVARAGGAGVVSRTRGAGGVGGTVVLNIGGRTMAELVVPEIPGVVKRYGLA